MRHPAVLASLFVAAVLCGCPDDPKPDPKAPPKDGAAAVDSETSGATPETVDPLAGSIFTKEQLFAIYRGELTGGEARKAALAKNRLIDKAGNDVPLRVKAYERALKQYAERDPEGWSAFLETLPQ